MAKKIKGCLDPGHAFNTPGKAYGSFKEYLSNRNIANKLKRILEATGKFEIVFSCDISSPTDASLTARAANAVKEGCEFIVSIHSNAGPASARGTETFLHTNSTASLPLAQALQKNLVAALKTKDRGVKKADFGILRGTYKNMLSVLTEGEFYTNLEANKWMITADYENKYAQGVANGLFAFYKVAAPGEEKKEEAPFMLEKAIVVNAFGDTFAAEPLAKRLKCPVFFRDTAEQIQVAKQIFVCGGSKEGLKGNDFVVLSGPDRWEASKAIGDYTKKV